MKTMKNFACMPPTRVNRLIKADQRCSPPNEVKWILGVDQAHVSKLRSEWVSTSMGSWTLLRPSPTRLSLQMTVEDKSCYSTDGLGKENRHDCRD